MTSTNANPFAEMLAANTVFANREVLSPHYVPEKLPHRDSEIAEIIKAVSPVVQGGRPKNLFIYGKTGTGKSCSVKYVVRKLEEIESAAKAKTSHINCRVYNSRYRVVQKIVKDFMPDYAIPGYGITQYYEHVLDWLEAGGYHLMVVLDEIDMVKDLDDLMYTLTRANDDLNGNGGTVSIIGITNRVSFKDMLDPRSKSSLCENEIVFRPYNAEQLQAILKQRIALGFKPDMVDDGAINLAAAIAARENGDARYALKILLRAGEIANDVKEGKVAEKHVEKARSSVDEDVTFEVISTLPEQQQLVLYSISILSMEDNKYAKLTGEQENFLFSGDVYEHYSAIAKRLRRKPRTARWYREYLNDLEMLGLITTVQSGKGIRGHTTLIKIGYPAGRIKEIIEKHILGDAAEQPEKAG